WIAVVDKAVFANAERKTLINRGSLILRLNAFYIFPTARINRIIHVLVRAFGWLLFGQEAVAENTVGIAVFRIEVKGFRICDQIGETVSVFPFPIRTRISRREQIVRDLIL